MDRHKNEGRLPKTGFVFSEIAEVIVILLVIAGLAGIAGSIVFIIGYSLDAEFAVIHSQSHYDYWTLLYLSMTVSFIPMISILVAIVIDYRNSASEIRKDLARKKNLKVGVDWFPLGLDLESAEMFHEVIPESVFRYDGQLKIFFSQEIAELYQVTLGDVFLSTKGNVDEKKTLILRDSRNPRKYAMRNNSGIYGESDSVLVIALYLEKANGDANRSDSAAQKVYGKRDDLIDFLKDMYSAGSDSGNEVCIDFNFVYDSAVETGVRNFFLIRWFMHAISSRVSRTIYVRMRIGFELDDEFQNGSRIDFHVNNLSLREFRNYKWKAMNRRQPGRM